MLSPPAVSLSLRTKRPSGWMGCFVANFDQGRRMAEWRKVRPLRTLDFDCENRPLSYLGQDFTTAEPTGIAAQFIGSREMFTFILGEMSLQQMLLGFVALYIKADLVVGHYIRKHDLPMLNGMLLEQGLAPLPPKMTTDTYLDLKIRSGISSSQANLAETLGIKSQKYGMSTPKWRQANRLEPSGIELTRKRVTADVKQNIRLREELLKRHWLRPPRLWQP